MYYSDEGTLYLSGTVAVFFVLTLVVTVIFGYYAIKLGHSMPCVVRPDLTAEAAEADDCIRITYNGGIGEGHVEAIAWTFRNTREERLDGREEHPKPGFTYTSPAGATDGPDHVIVTAIFFDGRTEVILDTAV